MFYYPTGLGERRCGQKWTSQFEAMSKFDVEICANSKRSLNIMDARWVADTAKARRVEKVWVLADR